MCARRGFGGAVFSANGVTRLVMGGGGGAGDNNANSQAVESSGAAGGGIVMVRAVTLTGSGTVSARGARAADNPLNDGAGGGGAGGSVLIVATTWSASPTIDVRGGRGGDAWATGGSAHGSGGGGGGGVVISSSPVAPMLGGGSPGITNTAQAQPGGVNHGAQAGGDGVQQTIAPAADTPGSDVGRTCKADLSISKTNASSTVDSGATTVYTVTVTNDGPKPANNAVVRDPALPGLACVTNPTCAVTGGAACPVSLDITSLQGAGLVIPSLPSGGVVTLSLTCTVTATGLP